VGVHIEPAARRGWEDEGERIALGLERTFAALIVGSQPREAARLALAIAKFQARRRRVAVVDAVGELAPIEKLLPGEIAHGLVDMLSHGVSLGRAAVPVDRAGNLFVIPSGAAPFDQDETFSSDRWPRLVQSFRDAGALLLVVAPAGSSALERIAPLFDGVVLVDDAAAPAGAPLLAHARRETGVTNAKGEHRSPARRSSAPRAPYWVAIAATVLAMAALGWWAVQSSIGSTDPVANSVTSAGAVVDGGANERSAMSAKPIGDSAGGGPGAPAGSTEAATASTATSSAAASAPIDTSALVPYGVALAQYNDVTAALTRIAQEAARGIPASTYSPFYDNNLRRQVFLVIAGAFHDRTAATSLLRSLRRQGALALSQGHVIDAPFAVLVSAGASAEQAKTQLEAYRLKGMPVYALVQPDGTMNIYAGAFRNAADAESLVEKLGVEGGAPRVVKRAGRPSQ
jgi:hypothetical protein